MEGTLNPRLEKDTIYEIYRACRLCGAGAGYKMPIVQNVVDLEDTELNLSKKIRECLQIQVHPDDKMPPLICELCVDKVNDFYIFLELCRHTNKRTRQRLGLPMQTTPKGAPESANCILGDTEPIYVNDDSDGEPLAKHTNKPKLKEKDKPKEKIKPKEKDKVKAKEPEIKVMTEEENKEDRIRSCRKPPVRPATPAASIRVTRTSSGAFSDSNSRTQEPPKKLKKEKKDIKMKKEDDAPLSKLYKRLRSDKDDKPEVPAKKVKIVEPCPPKSNKETNPKPKPKPPAKLTASPANPATPAKYTKSPAGPGKHSTTPAKTSDSPAQNAKRPTGPAKRNNSPAGRTAGPAKRNNTIAGQLVGPAKRNSAPAGRSARPAKRNSSPAGRPAGPAKRNNSLAGQPVGPGKRNISPAGRPAGPAKRNNSLASQPAGPAKRNTSPAGQPAKPTTPENISAIPVPCKICGLIIKNAMGFYGHTRTHVVTFTKKALSCNACGEWFTNKVEASEHHSKHKQDEIPYKCRRCTAEYKQQQEYDDHFGQSQCIPYDEVPDVKCEECWKYFATDKLLIEHKCLGEDGRPGGKCSNCKRSYGLMKNLRVHEIFCTPKKKDDIVADPKVLSRLNPVQVRTVRCDPLLLNKVHGHYNVSNIKNFGFDRKCTYPYKAVKAKQKPFKGMVKIQEDVKQDFCSDEYIHWDMTDNEEDVSSLSGLCLKTIFSQKFFGRVPKKRKVKSDSIDNGEKGTVDVSDVLNCIQISDVKSVTYADNVGDTLNVNGNVKNCVHEAEDLNAKKKSVNNMDVSINGHTNIQNEKDDIDDFENDPTNLNGNDMLEDIDGSKLIAAINAHIDEDNCTNKKLDAASQEENRDVDEDSRESTDVENRNIDEHSPKTEIENQNFDEDSQKSVNENHNFDGDSHKIDVENLNFDGDSKKTDVENLILDGDSEKSDVENLNLDINSKKTDVESLNEDIQKTDDTENIDKDTEQIENHSFNFDTKEKVQDRVTNNGKNHRQNEFETFSYNKDNSNTIENRNINSQSENFYKYSDNHNFDKNHFENVETDKPDNMNYKKHRKENVEINSHMFQTQPNLHNFGSEKHQKDDFEISQNHIVKNSINDEISNEMDKIDLEELLSKDSEKNMELENISDDDFNFDV